MAYKEYKRLQRFFYDNGDGFSTAYMAAPGVGKQYLIWGASSYATDCKIYTASQRLLMVPGNSSLVLPVPVSAGENMQVDVGTDEVMILYTIENLEQAGGRY